MECDSKMNSQEKTTTYGKIDLNNVKSAAEAMEIANCSWIAEPINTITESGKSIPIYFKSKAIVRSDTGNVIGQVGKRYNIIQNNDAFSFFDTICEKFNANYSYVHILNHGSKIILSAQLTDNTVLVRPNDEVQTYINLINTFDGSMPLTAMSYYKRLVCSNGLIVSGKTKRSVIKHTGNFENKIQEAMRILNISLSNIQKFEENSKILANKMLDSKQVDSFLNSVLNGLKSQRKLNQAKKIEDLFTSGQGNGKGSAWDLYNGYVEWIDYHRSNDNETRNANAILGASNIKEHAFDIALSL